MSEYAINVGDTLRVTVNTYGEPPGPGYEGRRRVRSVPTWYPQDKGPLYVGNLNYLFERAGGLFPYEVWISTESCTDTGCAIVDYPEVLRGIQALGMKVITPDASVPVIIAEQRRPERQVCSDCSRSASWRPPC